MIKKPFAIDGCAVEKALATAAMTYDANAEIPNLIADRLLNRLDCIRLKPEWIMDFGVRIGYTTRILKKRYNRASIIGVESSLPMLLKGENGVVGEYTSLPFIDHSIDLVFSNLTFHWSVNLQQTLKECRRVLKPEGLLLFSTVGPETLRELRESFSDGKWHVHAFYDMHDIGDMLTCLSFVDTVMDMERLTVYYESVFQLLEDLKLTGAHNAAEGRCRGLMGKMQWEGMLKSYEEKRNKNGALPVTLEVVYGHAFGTELSQYKGAEGEVFISINKIKRAVR
ncbi:methyltransferase domain-containing protein [Coxiella endosymbiont of Amblyomma nuttalli]|uniref:methyltransferase domain-containing protein n=1 Tax=Coxiella endosymbiont of Amblyomma nuttalli TaxID=2749996 RepID=UPI001BAA953A|nr:methyltransferase domain-containing protein [Coxiella endosymbiont of Amblyomma nuttalli]QTS83984.1 Malonyl-[acyl-carrier protein] O-methyltransferase [Coxiella endosymbiont of Amblyomma nuttalli]